MTPYLDDGDVRIYVGDALKTLAGLTDGSVDCVVKIRMTALEPTEGTHGE